ncbi:MAG: hypothetical protein KGI68_14680 [Alphaproteobacteria bacterium]|nr:hypothetical protein [Alphaproteobacteria bacterium]
MKRLISAALALTLLSSTAAMADGWHGQDGGRSYHHQDNTGAFVAAGIGLAALAIIASQHNDRHDGYYVQGRYGNGYDNSGYYTQSYGGRGDYRSNDRQDYRQNYRQDYQHNGDRHD